jgi:FkbM family methyltransferase
LQSPPPFSPDDPFKGEYEPKALIKIVPKGHSFQFSVPPRYFQPYVDLGYEPATAKLIRRLASKADLFVDAGAHCGFYSMVAATANAKIGVIAIEPSVETANVLRLNLSQIGDRAKVHEAALSDREGKVQFFKSAASDSSGLYPHPNAPVLSKVQVASRTLDAVLSDSNPKRLVVKIDTEGHEVAVLSGLAQTVSRLEDVTLIVECNQKMLALAGLRASDLVDKLDSMGFDVFAIDEDMGTMSKMRPGPAVNDALDLVSYANLYCPRKGKVLSAAFISHSSSLNGAERSLHDLVQSLVADHDIVANVILPNTGPLGALFIEAGAGCIELKSLTAWASTSSSGEDLDQYFATGIETFLGSLLPALSRFNPDVIFTQTTVSPWGAAAAALLRLPHVWSVCEFGAADHGLNYSGGQQAMTDSVKDGSSFILTNSNAVRTALFPGLSDDHIKTVYRHVSIPDKALDAADTTAIAWRHPASFKLGLFGALHEGKGQVDAIRAVQVLVKRGHNVELLLAGHENDEYRAELDELAHGLNVEDRIVFAGFRDNPYPLMRSVNVLLVCSRMEAFGRVVVEGMLLERPVVYARAGGIPEYMVDGRTGLSYRPGTIDDLAGQIERLIRDPAAARTIARDAKSHALATFTADRFEGEISRCLRRVAAEGTTVKMPRPVVRALSDYQRQKATELAASERAIETANGVVSEQHSQLVEFGKALAHAEGLVGEHRSQHATLSQGLADAERLVKEQQAQHTALSNALVSAEGLIKGQQSDYSDLTKALANSERLIKEQQAQNGELTKALATLEKLVWDQKAESQAQNTALSKGLTGAESLIIEQRTQYAELTKAMAHAEVVVANQQAQITETNVALTATQGLLAERQKLLAEGQALLAQREAALRVYDAPPLNVAVAVVGRLVKTNWALLRTQGVRGLVKRKGPK